MTVSPQNLQLSKGSLQERRSIALKTPRKLLLFLFILLSTMFRSSHAYGITSALGKEAVMALSKVEAIGLPNTAESLKLGDGFYYSYEETPRPELDQFLNQSWPQTFKKLTENNLGISKQPVWIIGKLKNESHEQMNRVFEIDFALMDYIDYYVFDSQGHVIKQGKAGDLRKLSEREIRFRNPVFSLSIGPHQSQILAFRIVNHGPTVFNSVVWKTESFIEKINREQFINGIYYGLVAMMILYNFFMWLSYREKVYALYISYTTLYSLFLLNLNGLAYELLWPEYPIVSSYSVVSSGTLSFIFVLAFSDTYLKLKDSFKSAYVITQALKVAAAFIFAASFFINSSVTLALLSGVGAFGVVFVAAVGLYKAFRGDRPSLYFSFAWFIFAFAIVILSLRNIGLIPHNFFSIYGAQIGSGVEMIVVSFGIAKRLDEERRERVRAKEEALRLQKKAVEDQIELNMSFERFVPHDFIELLGKQNILEVELGQQVEKRISTLFCDIRSYTSLSEKLGLQNGFAFLSSYYGFVAPVIRSHQGVIDKYIGDAIMAIFERSAEDAVAAGLNLINRVSEFNSMNKWTDQPIKIGIGINTGSVILGIIGEAARLEGTVIGDAVNQAARLEKLTVEFGVPLIITGETYQSLKMKENFKIRFIGTAEMRGKNQKVLLYEVFDHNEPLVIQLKLDNAELFQKMIDAYISERWFESLKYADEYLAVYPEDSVAIRYKQICSSIVAKQEPLELKSAI